METNQIQEGVSKLINWKLTFKVLVIGMIILILLISKFMILELISERQKTSEEARQEVASKWSNRQSLRGPVLTVPYLEKVQDEDKGTIREEVRECCFLPETLNIEGELRPKELYRSIYETVVYESSLQITGHFEKPDFGKLKIDPRMVLWDKASLSFAISDLRGINTKVNLKWNSGSWPFSPGMDNKLAGDNGISLILPDSATFPADFQIKLELKGSEGLQFAPLGETTLVTLRSAWNDPGFTGNFLPEHRTVTPEGFTASWKVLDFNRNFPQQWKGNAFSVTNADFGVNLLKTADHYQKCMRCTKYGMLVILLIFLSFFLNEIIARQKIHPFQYILVGFAVLIFYLLLLSITEQLGFNPAYLIAALSVVTMVFLYSRTFLKTWMNSALLTLILASSFAFIFVLLQLESYALLVGSTGLFFLLGLTMFLTRKIDWYNE